LAATARSNGRTAARARDAAVVLLACASPVLLHLAVVYRSRILLVGFLAAAAAGIVAARLPCALASLVAVAALGALWIDLDIVAQLALAGPAVAFLAAAWVFGRTLRPGRTPLVEQISRVERGGDFPAGLTGYARRLTLAWALLLAGVPVLDVALALFGSVAAQSLLVNVLSWTLIAALFFGDYAYRRWRYPQFPHKNPLAVARNLLRRAPELFRT
jgi:uncharacterized membrane protein